ncbi:MAG: hypothetical protein WDA75_10255, partial [Candidatus Latescibacterota bacterium]
MKEGEITHEEVNAAIAAAPKTIIFGRQNRLRDGLLLPDEKLPRFHAGHENVRFFYSAVRQLPEYLLDALLAKGVSVTLALGQGLLAFRDVRNHQAVHSGRTRRTIYLPEKVLEVAVANGYDYWAITHVLIGEGWKLLDFILLHELVQAGKQHMLEHSVPVLGWNTVRRLLTACNRHRSAFESAEKAEKNQRWGLNLPLSETGEFLAEYEERLLRAMRFSPGGRLVSAIPRRFREMSPDEVAKALWHESVEERWAAQRAEEIGHELQFPDYFLLDRDIVHPAARELAEAAGQELTPATMDEARHDYRDRWRFGIGRELATEWLVAQGLHFAPEGLAGLVEEVASGALSESRVNQLLLDKTLEALLRLTPQHDQLQWVRDGEVSKVIAGDLVRWLLNRGIDLVRLRDLVLFNVRVRAKEVALEPSDLEDLREQMVRMVGLKGPTSEAQRLLILGLSQVEPLFEQLQGVLVGEAKRLFGHEVQAEEMNPPEPICGRISQAVEQAMLRLTLCLELMPDHPGVIERLARSGTPLVESVLEEYLHLSADDPGRQIGVAAARRGLAARQGGPIAAADGELADLYARVEAIAARLPDRPHEYTSRGITRLRRALKEFEQAHRGAPTHPRQLGPLAMVLVRLDRHDRYSEFLAEIRWIGDHAVGHLAKGGGLSRHFTPGLLRVIDEESPLESPVLTNALTLAEELTGVHGWENLKIVRTL